MKILLQNGETIEKKIFRDTNRLRGLRFSEITLDKEDLGNLLNMHEDDIVKFLVLAKQMMHKSVKN